MQEMQVQFLGRKIPWRREWQPTPVFLPGKFHGQRSLAGCSPWSCKSPHDVVTKPHFLHNMESHLLPLLPQSSICLKIYLPEPRRPAKVFLITRHLFIYTWNKIHRIIISYHSISPYCPVPFQKLLSFVLNCDIRYALVNTERANLQQLNTTELSTPQVVPQDLREGASSS